MALTAPRTTTVQVWGSPTPKTSTNGYRKSQAAHHNAWGSATGASMPRGPHRAFSGVQAQPKKMNPSLESMDADADPDLYPVDPRVFQEESAGLYSALQQNNLVFTYTVPAPDTTTMAPSFYADLNSEIHKFMAKHGLRFSVEPDPLPFSVERDTPEWHAQQVSALPWTFCQLGQRARSLRLGRKISATNVPWHAFTEAGLKKALMGLKNFIVPGEYYLMAPKSGPLLGTPFRMSGEHACLPLRVLLPLTADYIFQPTPIECVAGCPAEDFDSPPRAPRPAQRAQGVFIEEVAAVNSDEEEDFMAQAIRRSIADAPHPTGPAASSSSLFADAAQSQVAPALAASSSAAARGESSRRPLPPLPLVRRRSTEASPPPPPHRRRLNPVAIDLTRSPSPEVSQPTFRTVTSWSNCVDSHLSRETCYVSASTTEVAVTALLAHFKSFFGGPPYVSSSPSEAFTIRPATRFGLLAKDTMWSIGEASGPGPGKNTMTELMNLVFSDRTVWKKIGNVHVIDTLIGITPDADRERQLKAYGFACMIYMIQEECIPAPMSTLFTYSILEPDGDNKVLTDRDFLRAVAPTEFELLAKWPSDRADCLAKINNVEEAPTLRALTLEYFNKSPEMLAALSPEMFMAVTHSFYRQVLFSSPIPFASSADIQAFRVGFDSPLSSSLPLTLGQSFGASRKTLIPHMSSARIESPQQVLDRIQWLPTNDDAYAATEESYKTAFTRYLMGKGIVQHPLLPADALTEEETSVAADDPCARARMFLMTVTGSPQLPSSIDVAFVKKFTGDQSPDPALSNPQQNPENWPDYICPVKAHTCYNGVDFPLFGMPELLEQPLPDDDSCTDFDLYQYMMYRPVTRYSEFGGIV
ncbi:hypothetical protein C8R43DRAFT_961339 [Mycena crocata]|nr:hypothetical protein C8R43DRAFT_961339 [Mycena crocata]